MAPLEWWQMCGVSITFYPFWWRFGYDKWEGTRTFHLGPVSIFTSIAFPKSLKDS